MISLGIDTGGTYTDAVIYCSDNGVLAKSKSPTTREDLSVGIMKAVNAALSNLKIGESSIGLVSISTTLATNAIVEGHGGRVCLILIGISKDALNRSKLSEAIGSDPVIQINGGHNADSSEIAALDENQIIKAIEQYDDSIQAYAVVSHFASRNSGHEERARQLIEERSAKPVTCSIDLSSKLDAPRRALTAVLNGRLIPLIVDLIDGVERALSRKNIKAPMMIMQGDGSLLRADRAVRAPVETILSGPAASIVGAAKLANVTDAVISDIGGTTTDIAVMRDGLPQSDSNGCTVAGWRTMVEAVRVFTYGLGGDSEVSISNHVDIELSAQRAIPVGMLASQYPKVATLLDRQLSRPAKHYDGVLVVRYRTLPHGFQLTTREQFIWDQLENGPMLQEEILENAALERPLERLRRSGWIAISTITPTDAAQFLGLHSQWDEAAVKLAMSLFIRCLVIDQSKPEKLAQMIIDKLVTKSARYVFQSAWLDDGGSSDAVSDSGLLDSALNQPNENNNCTSVLVRLNLPLVGIGAPAQAYYPNVAAKLDADSIVPEHYEVCNAVGAVVSGIIRRKEALISLVSDRVYRLYLGDMVKQSDDIEGLAEIARQRLTERVVLDAKANGGKDITVEFKTAESKMTADSGEKLIIERRIIAIATAAPF